MPDNIYDTDLQMQMYTDFLFLQILIIKVFSNYDQNTDPKASWVFFLASTNNITKNLHFHFYTVI